MDDSTLTDVERRFLAELDARGVRYLIVGLTAAVLQGANTTTVDIDLWFESTADPRIAEAATGDRFDVVNAMSGLADFATEYGGAKAVSVEGLSVRVLPLARILASKRTANRAKDLAAIPALEEALAASADLD